MSMRMGRALRATGAAVAIGLVIGACQSTAAGSAQPDPDPYRDAGRAAFEEAVSDLETLPAMQYTTMVDTTRLDMTVTRTGAAHGVAEVDGVEIELVLIDGELYLRAGEAVWEALGASGDDAKEFAGKLIRIDPADLGFDPAAALTPERVARDLREAVDAEEGSDRLIEKVTLDVGTEVYRIPIADGSIDITVAEPHRVVRTDLSLINAADWLLPGSAGTGFHEVDAADLESVLQALEDALDQVKSSYVLVPDLVLVDGGAELDCASAGQCTVSQEVTNALDTEFTTVSIIEVTMSVTLDGGALGTKTCTDDGTMEPNAGTTLSCSATFSVPADGVSYPIEATSDVIPHAKYEPDVQALETKLQEEFAEMLAELE